MSLATLAAARLVAAIPALEGRIGTALQFSQAMQSGSLGQVDLSAYLLPLGFRGGSADAVAGVFRQRLDRMFSVVIVKRAVADPLGGEIADELGDLIDKVLGAIAGWGPENVPGVFQADRGELVSLSGGVATFQIDFSLNDQLRIFA